MLKCSSLTQNLNPKPELSSPMAVVDKLSPQSGSLRIAGVADLDVLLLTEGKQKLLLLRLQAENDLPPDDAGGNCFKFTSSNRFFGFSMYPVISPILEYSS